MGNCSCRRKINGVSEKKTVADKTVVKKKEGLDTNAFALECLVAHNEKRAKHKAPPLRLSKKLCKYSEEWAKHLAATGKLVHRPESAYGENLFLLWSSTGGSGIKGSEPVDNWYAEISDHIFDKEPSTLKTGHFTQVVWLESEELGVGVARSPDMKHIYVVCNYNPPGNFIGSFADNVPPIGGFPKKK
uniref:Golgi-associated plant pathogenesis-related protein 1 n=1 Tax=Lygus hesperus TaxID=30085 RepID=A0A0A9Z3Z5_LYGHE